MNRQERDGRLAILGWLAIIFTVFGCYFASAQYTGARTYDGTFASYSESPDDGEVRFTNESEYPMVIVLESRGKSIDHAYINSFQTHTFDGLPKGIYNYKAEVRDGGNSHEYIEGQTNFNILDNVCPEGYECSGRSYQMIKVFYTIQEVKSADSPKEISKSKFFTQ